MLDDNPKLQFVATAHNATDNTETVLFHMARGCGLRGLCGIPMMRGRVLRPMLSVSKAEIVEALNEAGQTFAEDATNADVRYTRNFIRRDLLPGLRKINPGSDTAISSMCIHLRDDLDFIEQSAEAWLERHDVTTRVSASDLSALAPALARRVIVAMYRAAGGTQMLEEVHIEPLLDMVRAGHTTFIQRFPGAICAYAERGRIVFSGNAPQAQMEKPSQNVEMGENHLEGRDAILILTPDPDYLKDKPSIIYKNAIKANLSSVTIHGSLYVRERTEGDSYRYGGMTHKLKKLFADRRLSSIPKNKIPVLCDDEGVVWVPGFAAREDKGKTEKRALYVYYCYLGGQNE